MLQRIISIIITILCHWIIPTNQKCTFNYDAKEMACMETSPENFLYDIFDTNNRYQVNLLSLEVKNSKFTSIKENFPITEKLGNLRSLSITNSLVKHIDDGAFTNLPELITLTLSDNKLKTIKFVKSLNSYLKVLNLNDNNLISIDSESFNHLVYVNTLDLSNCNITQIAPNTFASLRDLSYLNLSHNNLIRVSFELQTNLLKFDLNSNKIIEVDFYTNSGYYDLDLSFNYNFENYSKLSEFSFRRLYLTNANVTTIDATICKNNSQREVLDLSNNMIKNLSLDAFAKCSSLTDLNLSNTTLKNIEPNSFIIKYFNKRNILNISGNYLTILKNYIFNQSTFHTIDISDNLIEIIEPKAFFGLRFLTYLDLKINKIQHIPKTVFNSLPDLRHIDLSNNPIKQLNLNVLQNCTKLSTIILTNGDLETLKASNRDFNDLTLINVAGNSLKNISGILAENAVLNLENNKIADIKIQNLFVDELLLNNNEMQTLKKSMFKSEISTNYLDLSQANITNIESDFFENFIELRKLNLNGNYLKAIEPLENLHHLEELDLSNNPIESITTKFIDFGNKLTRLKVSFNGDLRKYGFITLNFLKSLEFSKSNFTVLHKNCFKGLLYLEELILSDSRIDVIEPGCFNGLNTLQNLDLSNLSLKNLQPQSFLGLIDLTSLNLSHNSMTILRENIFQDLTNLIELSITFNYLVTIELGTFQSLINLKRLNLSGNHLVQIELGVFSNLGKLTHLDLSRNQISSIEQRIFLPLFHLEFLDLSDNKLKNIAPIHYLYTLSSLRYLGINGNPWGCDTLEELLIILRKKRITLIPNYGVFTELNIDGISCTNMW